MKYAALLVTFIVQVLAAPLAFAACGWIETRTTVCTTFGDGTQDCETTSYWNFYCLGGGGGNYVPGTGSGGGGGSPSPPPPPSGNHFDYDGDGEMDCFLNLVESTKTTQNPLPTWANLGARYGGPGDGIRWPHNGIDVAAYRGDRVRAGQAGTVTQILTGQKNTNQDPNSHPNGNFVRVSHSDGTEGVYLHLHAIDPGISVGSSVYVGQTLGTANDTGASDGDHLHYSNWIVRGQSAENPETNHGNCP